MRKKELSIKIDYISIVFDILKADELIRKVLGLPLEYFEIQNTKIKHIVYGTYELCDCEEKRYMGCTMHMCCAYEKI